MKTILFPIPYSLAPSAIVEAEVPEDEAKPISTNVIKEIKSSFAKVKPILISISRPIAEAWQEINKDMEIEQAEMEVGFNFEGEGNLYIPVFSLVRSSIDPPKSPLKRGTSSSPLLKGG